jgi:hypothetical protein
VCLEGIGATAARLVVEVAVFEVVDLHAASPGIVAPDLHAFAQRFPLTLIKSTWELQAQFFEQV